MTLADVLGMGGTGARSERKELIGWVSDRTSKLFLVWLAGSTSSSRITLRI